MLGAVHLFPLSPPSYIDALPPSLPPSLLPLSTHTSNAVYTKVIAPWTPWLPLAVNPPADGTWCDQALKADQQKNNLNEYERLDVRGWVRVTVGVTV